MKAVSVKWTKIARNDLRAIKRYIAIDSPWYSKSVTSDIARAAKDIGCHPTRFTICPEWKSVNTRHRVVHGYRIIYDILPSGVLILGIIHEKRILENVKDNRF